MTTESEFDFTGVVCLNIVVIVAIIGGAWAIFGVGTTASYIAALVAAAVYGYWMVRAFIRR